MTNERESETETETESETRTETAASEEAMETAMAMNAADLAAVRELALRAYPDTVPELVAGDSVAALLGSLEPAAAAYQRIAAGVAAQTPPPTPPIPPVPAGSAPPVAIDPERLPPVEKIRRALAARR